MTTSTKGASTEARDVRTPTRDRYITCAVKINGAENGRTEILDTMTDGGEGEPLIVASFFDRNTAEMFCRAANALPDLLAVLTELVADNRQFNGIVSYSPVWRKVEDAIAKAEGREVPRG